MFVIRDLQEKKKDVILWLQRGDDGRIKLMAQEGTGYKYNILSIDQEGAVRTISGVSPDLGFKLIHPSQRVKVFEGN
jgi:hypothetical protein